MTKRIAILGDFNPAYSTHHALNDSVRQVVREFNQELQFDWISTDVLNFSTAFNTLYCGLWVAPGSPYKNMQNVIDTIRYVRENKIPTFGNCGGFQHMIIEFARNVCSIHNADHEETNPDATEPVISKLACSLVQQEEQLTITTRNSMLFRILKKDTFAGKYFCSYRINEKYISVLTSRGLKTTANSQDGQVRSFEIDNHPFFLGTLFQPALTSTKDQPDALIVEFVRRSIACRVDTSL
jgi:CTP synthase (UTP-ammonia lyase)